MIRVNKSEHAPESLTTTRAYDGEDVKQQLLQDQHAKCYLCERILSTDFQIEHLRSQQHNDVDRQNWNNLFLSCSYCNVKKLANYDDIADPSQTNIESGIKQEIDFSTKRQSLHPSLIPQRLTGQSNFSRRFIMDNPSAERSRKSGSSKTSYPLSTISCNLPRLILTTRHQQQKQPFDQAFQ